MRALTWFEDDSSAVLLRSALRDELDLIRRRVLATIALEYGAEPVDNVALQLEGDDPRAHAVAIEWLDVTLTGTDRACISLLEPGVSDSDRLRRLSVRFPIESEDTRTILYDLVEDRYRRWRQPWLSACALHDGFNMEHIHLDLVLEELQVRSPEAAFPRPATSSARRWPVSVNGTADEPRRLLLVLRRLPMILLVIKFPVRTSSRTIGPRWSTSSRPRRATERGNLWRVWYRSADNPNEWALVERFVDGAAGQEHPVAEFSGGHGQLAQWIADIPEIINVEAPGTQWSRMAELRPADGAVRRAQQRSPIAAS